MYPSLNRSFPHLSLRAREEFYGPIAFSFVVNKFQVIGTIPGTICISWNLRFIYTGPSFWSSEDLSFTTILAKLSLLLTVEIPVQTTVDAVVSGHLVSTTRYASSTSSSDMYKTILGYDCPGFKFPQLVSSNRNSEFIQLRTFDVCGICSGNCG